jgi:uncharacterized membrane protein YbhN (UPF0104 family)
MPSQERAVGRARRPRRAWAVLGALAGLGLLGLAVRGLDLGALAAALAQVHGGWLVAAAALQGLALLFGGLAWRVGLSAGVARLPVRHVLAAHWIGQAANTLLPARLGEVARVMAVRRHVGGRAPVARIAGSLAAQRLLGGVATFVVVVTVILVLPLPGLLGTFRPWAGGALGLAILIALVLPRLGLGRRAAGKVPERLRGVAANVGNGARVLRAGRARDVSLVIHMGELGAQLGSIIALLCAFQVQVPLSAALLVFCLLAMASVLPSLPGGFGFNQAAVVAPLGSLYGVGAPVALAFSLGMQATAVGVALLGGLIAVCHQRLGRQQPCRGVAASPAGAVEPNR